MTFSICHATFGRAEKAIATMKSVMSRATYPIQYIFACNSEDAPTLDALRKCRHSGELPPFSFIASDFTGSAAAWQGAALVSNGDILLQQSDDLELPDHFDRLILDECERQAGKRWNDFPTYIAVSDGFRKDSLCTCAVMNRKYYELAGHFIPPEYRSVHSDGEVTFRAKQRSRNGEATWIDAKNVVLLHRHHYNDASVPWDEVYARGNSPEAYASGMKLLMERNPGILQSRDVDWL